MIRISRIFIVFIGMLLCYCNFAQSQDSSAVQPLIQYDKYTPIKPRTFDKSLLKELQDNPDYHYKTQSPESDESFNLNIGLQNLTSVLEIVTYVGLGILLSVILYVLIQNFIRYKPDQQSPVKSVSEDQQDVVIRNYDLEKMFRKAVEAQDYRLAIRFLYLAALQKLYAKQKITYERDKTNYDYGLELKEDELKNIFKQLTRQYEFVWYGNFAADSQGVNQAETNYQKLLTLLNQ